MRDFLIAVTLGLGMLASAAHGQNALQSQEDDKAETDLGDSIDDLLEGDFAAPQTEADGEAENIEETPEIQVSYEKYQHATLRALDKITGRSTDIDVVVDAPIVFGSLKIEMKTCYQTPPELPPESAAFLQVSSTQAVRVESMEDGVDANQVETVSDENPRLFSGWMFASSPGLSLSLIHI